MGQPAQEQRKQWDGKQRIYLHLDSDEERELALDYLSKYSDDDPNARELTIRKVQEVRLDRLNETHVVIAIVRDINKFKNVQSVQSIPGSNQVEAVRLETAKLMKDHKPVVPVIECKPIDLADFYTPAGSRDADGHFNEDGFINALGAVCMPAAPRIRRQPDGKGNHTRFLTLRWG